MFGPLSLFVFLPLINTCTFQLIKYSLCLQSSLLFIELYVFCRFANYCFWDFSRWELTSVPRERGKSSATFWLQ